MDNDPYHNVTSPEDKVPKMNMKKCDMIAWLDKHGIARPWSLQNKKRQVLRRAAYS